MKKLFCSTCGIEIREEDVLGIGKFDKTIGKFAGLTVVTFQCSNCQQREYQVVDQNPFARTAEMNLHLELTPEEMIMIQREEAISSDDQLDFYYLLEKITSVTEFLQMCSQSRLKKMTDIGQVIQSPADVFNLFVRYNSLEQKRSMVIFLDDANKLVTWELFGEGTNKRITFDPKNIFRTAMLLKQRVSVILAHNHFSQLTSPSKKDILRTKRLVKAGEVLGIDFLDHVVIHQEGFKSFDQLNLI